MLPCSPVDNNSSSKPERVCEKFEFSMTERDYHDKVQRAFNFASKTVLNLLIHGKQLIPRLKSVKHYFLLDQGDFFVHFMDAAKEELSKQVKGNIPSTCLIGRYYSNQAGLLAGAFPAY